MGLHYGSLFSMHKICIAESNILNTNLEYQNPVDGDVINWSFGADLEYISNGTITLSLVFGNHERILAEKVQLQGSDKTIELFKGTYTVTKEDATAGLPFVKATFYSGNDIKVFLHYVNIGILNDEKTGPSLKANVIDNGSALNWLGSNKDSNLGPPA